MPDRYRLKKDIVIPAGTIFHNVDGTCRKYVEDNYGAVVGVTQNTSGELIYGVDSGLTEELSEWFEKVE